MIFSHYTEIESLCQLTASFTENVTGCDSGSIIIWLDTTAPPKFDKIPHGVDADPVNILLDGVKRALADFAAWRRAVAGQEWAAGLERRGR